MSFVERIACAGPKGLRSGRRLLRRGARTMSLHRPSRRSWHSPRQNATQAASIYEGHALGGSFLDGGDKLAHDRSDELLVIALSHDADHRLGPGFSHQDA